jgi:uncharacterized membrane protein YuzA (DUF378 family)
MGAMASGTIGMFRFNLMDQALAPTQPIPAAAV